MPHNPFAWYARVKGVEVEYDIVRRAVARMIASSGRFFGDGYKVRDVGQAADRLEGTYVVRLYSEFEAGLRTYWATLRDTQPPARDLMNAVAARRRIPYDVLADAHAVREYRNLLVHEGDAPPDPIPLAECRHRLCVFLSYLPPEWGE